MKLFLSFIFISSFTILKSQSLNTSEFWYKQGNTAVENKSYGDAIRYYSKALKLKPNDFASYIERGKAKHKLKKYVSAIEDFNQAIALDSGYINVFRYRADAKYELKKYQEAINDYNLVLKSNPNDAIIYNDKANAEAELGRYQEAIEDYNMAIKLNPTQAIYKNNLELALKEKSDTTNALEKLYKEAEVNEAKIKKQNPIVNNNVTVSLNLIQTPINELGIYVDYFFHKKHAIGFNIGKIYANDAFKVFVLSPDQGTYPGTVWNGFVARINYKYYFTNSKRFYVSAQAIYKRLSYKNQSFANAQGDNENTFVRSEDAYLLGLDLIYGYHIGSPNLKINLELFSGFGIRYRERDYTTISSTGYVSSPQPLGHFVINQTYPMFILGLKMGFRSFFKILS